MRSRIKPRAARRNFAGARLFVDATLAARLPFEMFHYIRHVDFFTVDAGFGKRSVEQSSSWPHKRLTAQIFIVPRLFSNEHDLRTRAALSENGLSGIFPKRAIATALRLASQFCNGFCQKIWLLPGGLWRRELRAWRHWCSRLRTSMDE